MIHKEYLNLSIEEKIAVDSVYEAVAIKFQAAGLNICGDDRAERLVEAMAVYVLDCRKK